MEFKVMPEAAISDKKNHRSKMWGKAIYVHPKERFATLEFKGVNGTFRESFPMDVLMNSRHRG